MNIKIGKAIVNGIAIIPLVWIAILYLFTLLCWLKLGHFPIPSLNDPKGIGFPILYFLSAVGMIMVVYGIIVWILLLPFTIKQKLLTKKNVIIMVVGSILSHIQLIADPFDLIYWLLD